MAEGAGARPKDEVIYKLRVSGINGAQPVYYSDPARAMARAREAKRNGDLLYFGEYRLSKVIEVTY